MCVDTYIPSFLYFLLIQITTEHWVEFLVLHSRFSLVIYFIHSTYLYWIYVIPSLWILFPQPSEPLHSVNFSTFSNCLPHLHCWASHVTQTVKTACHAGDLGLIPWSGRSPGERYDNPFQYSCLKNHMDRGAWWATVHGVTKSQTRLRD